MDDAMLTEKRNGLTIKIYQDDVSREGPREWDNLGTMACFHRRYDLGDKHTFGEPDELKEYVRREDVIALPLYLYDHSGITMRTKPFGCRWDSGQVGYVFVSHQKAKEEYSVKRIGKKTLATILKVLEGEVQVYNDHLTGNVYGFKIIDESGEEVEACWGFYGDYDKDGALTEAQRIVDSMTNKGKTDSTGQALMFGGSGHDLRSPR